MALIKVKAAKPESGEVALWEVNAEHPGGEAWVTGDAVVEVAETPDVLKKLAAGVILKIEDGKPADEPKPKSGKK